MTDPVPVTDPVRNVVRRLEAERMRPAPALTPQEQLASDLRDVIGVLAAAMLGDGWRP